MSRPFEVRLPLEEAYLRRALFAVELLDPVTLSRVSEGVKVVAEGLLGKPVVNAGGLFVWLAEDRPLRRLTVDPGVLPYDKVERLVGADTPRLVTIELPPRPDYAFPAGVTGLRGTLLEERVAPPSPRRPVESAEVHLRWLDEDGAWRDAPTFSRTGPAGDFAAILRLAPGEVPRLEAQSALTVRLRARREGSDERGSADLKLPQGRVADPSTFAQGPQGLLFAWDELQP